MSYFFISGTSRIRMWRGKKCPSAGLLVYTAERCSLATATSNLLTYTCKALTCSWFFGIVPCAPMLIIFQCSPTGMDPIWRDISPLMTSMSIVGAKNRSHPMETGFSNCNDDFHNLNLDFWSHDDVSLITFVNGSQKPRRAEVYMYPPLALGLAPGKYSSHLSTLPGSWSGSLIGSGRSSSDSYLLRLWGKTKKCASTSSIWLTKVSRCSNILDTGLSGFSGIGMWMLAQKTYGRSSSHSISSVIVWWNEGGSSSSSSSTLTSWFPLFVEFGVDCSDRFSEESGDALDCSWLPSSIGSVYSLSDADAQRDCCVAYGLCWFDMLVTLDRLKSRLTSILFALGYLECCESPYVMANNHDHQLLVEFGSLGIHGGELFGLKTT